MDCCRECGAPSPDSGDCWTRVHQLLEVETRALATPEPEAAKRTHFLAVATYQLQHPSRVTSETLVLLRRGVVEMLGPHPRPIEQLRREVGRFAAGSTRVGRRADDPVPDGWPTEWTMTVVDVLSRADEEYPAAVESWARSAVGDLDARPARASS